MPDILEKLQALLREFTGDDTICAANDTLLRNTLGLDSYDLASLLGYVEESFNIDIPARAVMGMLTVGDMVDYIAKQTHR